MGSDASYSGGRCLVCLMNIQEALKELYPDKPFNIIHLFSVEIDPVKQSFIVRNFGVNVHPIERSQYVA